MHPFPLFLVLLLLACGRTDADQSSVTAPNETSAPAPGVRPEPPATGDVSYQTTTLSDLKEVEGCSVLLKLDDGTEGYVFGFGYPPGVAEGHFGGQHRQFGFVEEQQEGDQTRYVHASADYEVVTTLSTEGKVGDEVAGVSGTVVVRELASGKELRLTVVGEQGC